MDLIIRLIVAIIAAWLIVTYLPLGGPITGLVALVVFLVILFGGVGFPTTWRR